MEANRLRVVAECMPRNGHEGAECTDLTILPANCRVSSCIRVSIKSASSLRLMTLPLPHCLGLGIEAGASHLDVMAANLNLQRAQKRSHKLTNNFSEIKCTDTLCKKPLIAAAFLQYDFMVERKSLQWDAMTKKMKKRMMYI